MVDQQRHEVSAGARFPSPDEMQTLVAYIVFAVVAASLAVYWHSRPEIPLPLFAFGMLLITFAPALVSYRISLNPAEYSGWIDSSSMYIVFLIYTSLIIFWSYENRKQADVLVLVAMGAFLIIMLRQSACHRFEAALIVACLAYLTFLLYKSLS